MFPAEVRYLNIAWSGPDTVVTLETSRDALECELSATGWQVHTTTFPSTFHTIGIKVVDSTLKHPPFLVMADGSRHDLLRVNAPGQKDSWWIHSNGWSPKHNRHLSELYRTAGRAEIVVQGKSLTLLNHTFNFSVHELEQYLADFKNDLWMLILDNASVTRGGVSRLGSVPDSENLLKALHEFVQSAEGLIQKPTVFLSEVQERLPLRSVRPVGLTFRELAVNPRAKVLTSRSYRESYDTPENRFVHYCVERVHYLLNTLLRTVKAQSEIYKQRIEQEKDWCNQLKENQFKRVNPKVLDNEIIALRSKISELDQLLSGLTNFEPAFGSHSRGKVGEYTMVFGGEYQNSQGRAFFVNRLNGKNFKATYGTYLVVWLPPGKVLPEAVRNARNNQACEIRIQGRFRREKDRNGNGSIYYKLFFDEVYEVSVSGHPWLDEIDFLNKERIRLEQNDWREQFSSSELKERKADIRASERKLAIYQQMNQVANYLTDHLPALKFRTANLRKFFDQHEVKQKSSCPDSMVFIQNPAYAAVKRCFRKLMEQNSLNESLFKSLMAIDDIGLVNVSNLYERWCLLQVLKVLTETYRFALAEGWQEKLIKLVLERQFNIALNFDSPQRQLRLNLTYELELSNGRRPDFVLDIFYKNYSQDPKTLNWIYTDEVRSRLVLDAKFRGDVSEGHIIQLAQKLFEEKDYSEGGVNQVFIVHPTPEVIQNMTSPLKWGGYCDYGQTCEHKVGSIFISPTNKHGDTVQNLQRLIGMFLQENSSILKPLDASRGVKAAWANIACISCGSTPDGSLDVSYEPTSAGSERWEISCGDCGLVTVKTICSSCHRPLFKNGPQWTYHQTRAVQNSNVVCPSCQTFL